MQTISFKAYETIGMGIPNFDFGEHSPEEARALVKEGKARWVLQGGGVLSIERVGGRMTSTEKKVIEAAERLVRSYEDKLKSPMSSEEAELMNAVFNLQIENIRCKNPT